MLGYLFSPKLNASLCRASASRSCPLDLHVCLYEVESADFRVECLESMF